MGRYGSSAGTGIASVPERTVPSAEAEWLRDALALLRKDVRAELRTKTAVSAVGVFAFASLLLIGLATATLKETQAWDFLRNQNYPAWTDVSKMGLLWTLLCFAAFAGLSHSFVHEEETGTVMALRLTTSSGAVYAGKLAFNGILLLAVALVVTPAYMLMTGMHSGPPLVFVMTMVSGCVGLGGAATIVAALTAKARGTGALFGALGLPLITVFLMLLLNAAHSLYGEQVAAIQHVKNVGGLLSYGILLIAVSGFMFRYVWED